MQYTASSTGNPSGVQGICPPGWHLPSDAEWCELENYIEAGTDPNCDQIGYRGTNTGGAMKEAGTTHWNGTNTSVTNSSGFSGLPGGYRYKNGNYNVIGFQGDWWSSTQTNTNDAWFRFLNYVGSTVIRSNYSMAYGLSVRCLRD